MLNNFREALHHDFSLKEDTIGENTFFNHNHKYCHASPAFKTITLVC